MAVDIDRNVDAHRLVLSLRGGLRVWPSRGQVTPRATFKLIVYPDLETADRDVADDGLESLFFGSVILDDGVRTDGGLTEGDFLLLDGEDGRRTLVPAGRVAVEVTADDAEAAVVRLVADTGEVPAQSPAAIAAPAVSTLGLVLLALMLAAAGWWGLAGRAGRRDVRT